MQNWLGVAFVALAALVVGVQTGRRGLAGAFRPVPLACVVSSAIVIWRLGLVVTAVHVTSAVALLVIGTLAGRAAGAPRTHNPFADEDDSYARMYRQAGMSPEIIDMERKFRQLWRETAALGPRAHVDRPAGFSLEIPPSWQPTIPVRDFLASGGRLSIAHVTGHANLSVSCGPLDEPRLADLDARDATLRRIVTESAYDDVSISRPTVSGETNVVRGDWVESDGGHAGLISIVRDGAEIVVQWKTGSDYTEETMALLDSFRLL